MPLYLKRCLSCGANLDADKLLCGFCGASHILTGDDLDGACPGCGTMAQAGQKACTSCGRKLVFNCPECKEANPLGSRFCQECNIEFQRYREPKLERLPNVIEPDAVEQLVTGWLEGRWFKARDIKRNLKIPNKLLYWVPFWTFQSRVTGHVQGKVSQTLYRNETHRHYDSDTKKWVREQTSVPYKVWNEISKDFDQEVSLTKQAAGQEASELYQLVGKEWWTRSAATPEPINGDADGSGEPWERIVGPTLPELAAYAELRERSERDLENNLLERVELFRARYIRPELTLRYYPVWEVDYLYKAKLGKVRINGVTQKIKGKKITLFSQWLS